AAPSARPRRQATQTRSRAMRRRRAPNAPSQGAAGAAPKRAMIRVDRELTASGLDCVMVLTVHDELVFDVATGAREAAAVLVKRAMEAAYPLSVPLRADLGYGANWGEAAPAGH